MRAWFRGASRTRLGPLLLVLVAVLAVVTMHALDHGAAHSPFSASDMHEEHRSGDADHGTGDADARADVAMLAASACAFVVLVPAPGVLRRRDALRRRYVDNDGAASQVLFGPEPPVPRFLLVMS